MNAHVTTPQISGVFRFKVGPFATEHYRVQASGSESHNGRTKCIIGISMGNPSHQSTRLDAILNWAEQSFGSNNVIVNVSDTLQRHNLLIEKSGIMHAAFNQARAYGAVWRAENTSVLEDHGISPKNTHEWDDWRKDPNFSSRLIKITQLENQDSAFAAAIAQDIDNFLKRGNRGELSTEQQDKIRENARVFLFEELAGYSCMFDVYTDAVRAYPGKTLQCFQYFKDASVIDPAFTSLKTTPYFTLDLHQKGRRKMFVANDSSAPAAPAVAM